jgi:hypothetical protein
MPGRTSIGHLSEQKRGRCAVGVPWLCQPFPASCPFKSTMAAPTLSTLTDPTVQINSSIVGFIRSSNSNNSCQRRLAQGANASFSNCARPCAVNSYFFQRYPSFMDRKKTPHVISKRETGITGCINSSVLSVRGDPA